MNTRPPIAAVLAGGYSRRMGTDKAQLPHPAGGSLLQHTCRLTLAAGLATVCLSRPGQGHRRHLAAAADLQPVVSLEETRPWEGPLLALAKLMGRYPGRTLVLLACDLPNLQQADLQALAAPLPPGGCRVSTDGQQQQPLLASYSPQLAHGLQRTTARGHRSFRHWLPQLPVEWLQVSSATLLNLNHPHDLEPWQHH